MERIPIDAGHHGVTLLHETSATAPRRCNGDTKSEATSMLMSRGDPGLKMG